MSLPTSRELREMLDEATSYPWQKEWGFIIASDREPGRVLADLWGAYGGVRARKEDIDLMLIAPQLAEEVIRLREEIDRLKWYCLDSMQLSAYEEDRADGETEKARHRGKQGAYYDIYEQMTKALHGENKEGDDK